VTDDTPTSTGLPTADTAAGGSSLPERAAAIANERPEVAAGAAFGGGLLIALILKRLAR
jgi:hypothetical protein